MSREQFIQTEIERAFEAADDDWKSNTLRMPLSSYRRIGI